MTWINLNDLYISRGGGVIEGDLTVDGTFSTDRLEQVRNALYYAHADNTVTFTPGDNYSSATGSAYLVGNNCRVYFYATRSSAVSGNITNETVATVSIDTNNRVRKSYTVSFCSGAEGHVSSFYTKGISTDDGVITFNLTLCAAAGSTSAFSGYFCIPVALNLNAY